MRYFEINEPYYALIKAYSFETAAQIYLQNAGDVEANEEEELIEIEDNMEEISRDMALIHSSRARDENGDLTDEETLLKEFSREVEELVLLDRSLL